MACRDYVSADFFSHGEEALREWVRVGVCICDLLGGAGSARLALAGMMCVDLINHVQGSMPQEEKEPEA